MLTNMATFSFPNGVFLMYNHCDSIVILLLRKERSEIYSLQFKVLIVIGTIKMNGYNQVEQILNDILRVINPSKKISYHIKV